MVFIVTGKSRDEVQEKIMDTIHAIERQGSFDYCLDVREVRQGHWKATLLLYFP